jgi:hypothetical protein
MTQINPASPIVSKPKRKNIAATPAPIKAHLLLGKAPIEIPSTMGNNPNRIQLKSASPMKRKTIPVARKISVTIMESRKLLSFRKLLMSHGVGNYMNCPIHDEAK